MKEIIEGHGVSFRESSIVLCIIVFYTWHTSKCDAMCALQLLDKEWMSHDQPKELLVIIMAHVV